MHCADAVRMLNTAAALVRCHVAQTALRQRPTRPQDSAMAAAQAVVMESLRLQTPMPLATRVLSATATLGGHRIPPGCLVHLSHRNANLASERFTQVEEFRPERFLDEGSQRIDSDCGGGGGGGAETFAPFGVGPRFCAGCAVPRVVSMRY